MTIRDFGNKFHREGVIASRFFDATGDGTGSIDMAVDGSETPVEFKITCPADTILELHRIIIYIKDTGTFDVDKYGNNVTVTNGMLGFEDIVGKDRRYFYTQLPIKTNGNWAAYCYDITYHSWGIGDNIMVARYTYTKEGYVLRLYPGDTGGFVVRDDLTDLTGHHFRAGLVAYAL